MEPAVAVARAVKHAEIIGDVWRERNRQKHDTP
jgi:hypothetical protein